MAHSFLAVRVSDIPVETVTNLLQFEQMLYSSDGARLMLDGYNADRQIVHDPAVLSAWVQWEPDPAATIAQLIAGAVEYTYDEYTIEKNTPTSIWYIDESNL